jgi:hypothetical protein
LITKVALGPTQQMVNIQGSTLVNGTTRLEGGLLALSSNIGHYSRDVFTVVPEVGLNLGYQLTDHLRLFVGYNFLYWSSVVRPGNTVQRAINPNLLPGSTVMGGPDRPAFAFRGSDFWAQGVSFGLEFRY